MKTITNGNNVKLHYVGTLSNGQVFDNSRSRGDTMSVLVGEGRVLPGFEKALLGMEVGQTKSISLPVEEAYGHPNPQAVQTMPRSSFPEDYVFEEGAHVQGTNGNGQPVLAKIMSFTGDEVTLDLNHPLAGKDINFEIEIVEIEETSEATE